MAQENLADLVDLTKLKASIENDREVLSLFQTNLVEHVREFCGSHYSGNGTDQANPVNLLSLYVRIITDQLVPSDPRFLSSTFATEVRPYASVYETWGNRKLVKMGFADILRTAITDAVFLMGVVKTSITAPAEARFGYAKAVGEVSMSNIAFEDMIFDTSAKKFHHCDYVGHYYDCFYDDVKGSRIYDAKAKLKVVPVDDKVASRKGIELIRELGRGGHVNNEQYHKKARLCEVWLRRENIVVTFDAEGDYERPLLIQKWVGPDCGPFKFLSLGDVLGNLIPKGPICDLVDMHREFNLLWRKLGNQASRSKKNHIYRDSGLAKRHEDAQDGQYIQSEDPNGLVEVASGGPDQNVLNYAMGSYTLFKQFAGNLDSIAGLASQSDTATQEKLVHASAGNLVQAMGQRVIDFAEDLMGMDGIGWFWWNNPHESMKASFSPPGVPDVSIERNVTPQHRFGVAADQIDIRIDVYSFQRMTPQMKKRSMDNMLQNVILKYLPLFNQPGVSDMLVEYVKLSAKLENNPDLEVLIEKLQGVQGPPAEQEQGQPEQPGMPSETTRTYERISKPGMSDDAHMQVLQQLTAGGKPQEGGLGAGGLGQMKAG